MEEGVWIASDPVTVTSTGYWGIPVAPDGYSMALNGRTYKVVQTVDGYPPSKKACYRITETDIPMNLNIESLGTED